VEALRQVDSWPVEHPAAAVVRRGAPSAVYGDEARSYEWKSVTKLATALAALVAAEEGILELDEPAGPEGSTVRHLLAHASGLPLDAGAPIAKPGTRRIYSNAGFELLADVVAERAEMSFERYLAEAVLEPARIQAELRGSPAAGLVGPIGGLVALARELLEPQVVAAETLAEATEVAFPGLAGVLPGFGRMEPNDWGLGFELRDAKSPHWTGSRNSARTFGHFGQSGSFLWLDPAAEVACVCLTDTQFGDWAKDAWPRLSDAVVAELTGAAV
jgi:CubicO group peptidase (beta-lactamase class C family)